MLRNEVEKKKEKKKKGNLIKFMSWVEGTRASVGAMEAGLVESDTKAGSVRKIDEAVLEERDRDRDRDTDGDRDKDRDKDRDTDRDRKIK